MGMREEIEPLYDIYLCGPLSSHGHVEDNLALFQSWAQKLRDAGYVVFSPPEGEEPGYSWPEYMCRDIPHLLRSRAVATLPGAETSRGAMVEMNLASEVGIATFHADTFLEPGMLEKWAGRPKLTPPEQPRAPKEESCLEEAARLITRDRGNQYGPPEQDFSRTAKMWSGLFMDLLRPGVEFKDFHVALAVMCVKQSRAMWQAKRDNWVDMAGYGGCGHRCQFGEW